MSQIKEILRRFKPVYVANNLFNYSKLSDSKKLYKDYGLKKSVISSISSEDFKHLDSTPPWLDQYQSSDVLPQHDVFKALPLNYQNELLNWSTKGYAVLESFFDNSEVESVNQYIEQIIQDQSVQFRYDHSSRLMNAIKVDSDLKDTVCNSRLENILGMLLGKDINCFQSINFLKGSQQKAHSDSIHMTTFPLGYLIAGWIALEDISEEQGPLFIYPGSHKLEYVLNKDFNPSTNYFFLGKGSYRKYEAAMEKVIEVNQFEKKILHIKKGDLVLWHANLIHGGATITNPNSTRKSMVLHYLANDVIKYHEITERPTIS